ncbi:MAG: sulfite exporter TauE/SafE family protein [Candidatus Nanoarchaeia archaeon]
MMSWLLLFIAGIGAGIVTGIFGGSATLIVVPLLVIFGGYHPYMAVGLALSIDVFSSLVAYYVYKIRNRITLKPALPMILSALGGVLIGSLFAIRIPENILTILAGFGILLASLKFIFDSSTPIKKIKNWFDGGHTLPVAWGFINGIGLGVIGGGGGIILLVGLTVLLGYPIHKAIGVSVLGMVALALVGAISHYALMPFSLNALAIGIIGGVIGALVSAQLANKLNEKKLNIIIGLCLLTLGAGLLIKGLFFI